LSCVNQVLRLQADQLVDRGCELLQEAVEVFPKVVCELEARDHFEKLPELLDLIRRLENLKL